MLVASDEIISRTKRIMRGIPVNADTQALDVLDEVGPGGHFLGHDHTYSRFKTETWRSALTDRQVYADWEASGCKDYQQRVQERMVEILEADTAPLLEPKMYQELRRICELADARHKDEELDVQMFV
jgi:trimethylamine--corrinoid protein Co-methyltransferase